MPDLKDRRSKLNPSQKDFDEIVNRPDMRALDDQGSAIAREHDGETARELGRAESSPEKPTNVYGNDGKEAARAAEAAEWKAPENEMGYRAPGSKGETPTASTRRKNLFRFGIAGIILTAVLALSGALLPLKIPGIMQMIGDEALQRVEHITERRARQILARAILRHIGRNEAADNLIITGDGPFKSLVATMRTSRFEDRLAKKGLTIEPIGDGGVRLRQNGNVIGGGVLRNEEAILRALDANRITSSVLRDIIKEDVPAWRWMKRAKFAKWLRLKYVIPKYGIENSEANTEEEINKEMQETRLTTEYTAKAAVIGGAATCILSSDNCQADLDGTENTSLRASADAGEVGNSAVDSVAEAVEAGVANPDSPDSTLMKTIVNKLGTKAIPILGWIDLFATLDNIAYQTIEQDYLGRVASYYRAAQYSQAFGFWSGYPFCAG